MRCAAGALLFLYRLVSQSDSKCEGMQASTYSNIYIYIYCSFNRKIPSFQHLSCCKSETQSSLPTQSLRDTAGNVACSSLQALCFTLPFNKTL